jgi:hypothetical protein
MERFGCELVRGTYAIHKEQESLLAMKRRFAFVLAVTAPLLVGSGCAKKGSKKEVADLQEKLEKEAQDHQTCKDKTQSLKERVTRLENALKKIKEQPCAFELDPVTLEVKRRADGPAARKTARAARPAEGPPLDVKKVSRKVRSVRRVLKRCYEEAAKRNDALGSASKTVTLRFTIFNSGKVGRIRLKPFVGSGFDKCVKSVVKGWEFDKFGGFPKSFVQRIHLTPK